MLVISRDERMEGGTGSQEVSGYLRLPGFLSGYSGFPTLLSNSIVAACFISYSVVVGNPSEI